MPIEIVIASRVGLESAIRIERERGAVIIAVTPYKSLENGGVWTVMEYLIVLESPPEEP